MVLPLLLAGCLTWQRVPTDQISPDKAFLQVGSSDIRYEVHGGGEPVLMVHGFGSSLETWGLVTPRIAKDHKVITPDLPGFGLSSKYEGDYTPSAMADALVGVLDKLDIRRADVVAHSYGCAVTLALAQEHPDRVRRVVLTDAFVYADQTPWFLAWARTPVLGETLFSLFYDQQMDWRMSLSFHDPRMVTQDMVVRASRALDKPGTKAAALAVARGLDLGEAEQGYGRMNKPTLLLWGEEDAVTDVRYAWRLMQQLPRARVETFPDAGHFPMVEAPGRYSALVRDFLMGEEAPW